MIKKASTAVATALSSPMSSSDVRALNGWRIELTLLDIAVGRDHSAQLMNSGRVPPAGAPRASQRGEDDLGQNVVDAGILFVSRTDEARPGTISEQKPTIPATELFDQSSQYWPFDPQSQIKMLPLETLGAGATYSSRPCTGSRCTPTDCFLNHRSMTAVM
jgi:hypothetical protein